MLLSKTLKASSIVLLGLASATTASAFPMPDLQFPKEGAFDQDEVTRSCTGMNQTCPQEADKINPDE